VIKVWQYWELQEPLEKVMGTYWEHIGNCKIKPKNPLPLAPLPSPTQKENLDPPDRMSRAFSLAS
jgi:hypothetical protein